ncbi:MAG: hypothetical protein JWM59_4944 [Verrucomicrobiales bacterium]|nr:hypothetical protein [Verrucomicrobiales bacterium]
MRHSPGLQFAVLSATVLTSALGAAFSYFQAWQRTLIGPMAVLLGLIWGGLGIGAILRARRGAGGSASRTEGKST